MPCVLQLCLAALFLALGSSMELDASEKRDDNLLSIQEVASVPDSVEGSGEEGAGLAPAFLQEGSSIKGIPNIYPKLPKTPEFPIPEHREYRRKQVSSGEYYQNKRKPTFIGSVLDVLGIEMPELEKRGYDLDHSLMRLFYDNAKKSVVPVTTTTTAPVPQQPGAHSWRCPPAAESAQTFDVTKMMGKWYQVMHSSNGRMPINDCEMTSYRMLNYASVSGNVGSTFETYVFSSDPYQLGVPQMSSGTGIVSRPGEILFRKSNGNTLVNVITTGPEDRLGQYEYVVLAADCYYPIQVYARNPFMFVKKHEAEVMQVLQRKGLVNDLSRILNFIKTVDFSKCVMPSNIFV